MDGFIFVAAHDSDNVNKLEADFVCDGLNDDEEIIAAIDLAYIQSSVVALSIGTYNIMSVIEL